MDYEKIIIQWMEFEIPETLPRHQSIVLNHDFITTIIGPRRAGKTYLCFKKIKELLKEAIPKNNILYINFEDEKLIGSDAKDLDELLNKFYELSEINKKYDIYLFLDEVHIVKNWDVWVRRINEMHKNIKIILTGSSSKLLSREISTRLRGRVLSIELYPLSFKEYLNWGEINYDIKTLSNSKDRFKIKKEFKKYLTEGGYPAILTNKEIDSSTILQRQFETVIFRDIVERHNIKEIKKLRILAKLLFESVTKEISYNRLSNKLKSLGFNISKNTIIEYISYFEDAYLFFQNLKYEYSLTKQLGSIKKVYCIDNGVLNSVSFKFSEDIGRLMENLVYVELKRRGKEIFYHKKNYECDFLVKEKNKITEVIQVTKELNDENSKREFGGLIEALEKYKLKMGTIITKDTEKEERIKGKMIKVTPIWKWLLTNNF
ncbi:MAG: ATP-binding protein [Nanoarchaeota archaeon]|nr:ATP-binding protein [Nanoarchaeota archaeon]